MNRSIDLALLVKHDRPAPDYGLFPTLVRLPEKRSADDYRLVALASNEDPIPKPLTVYVHVPSWLGHDSRGPVRYLGYLKREIALQSALFDGDRRIERLVLSGNGAGRLGDGQLAGLLAELDVHFGLKRSRDRDFALRIDPRGLSPQRLPLLAALGFNRLLVDLQDLETPAGVPGERQPADEWPAPAGPERSHLPVTELALRLSGRTAVGFSALLERLVSLRPERITLYRDGLCGAAVWPAFSCPSAPWQRIATPERGAVLALLAQGVERLVPAGYVHLGMGRFALASDALVAAQRHGQLQRCLEGYNLRGEADCIGLGAGAISHLDDGYYQNARELPDYCARLDAGQLAICRGYELTADDRVRQAVIQHLMGGGNVRYATVEKAHRLVFRNYFAPELLALQAMASDDLVELRRDGIEPTQSGGLLMERLVMLFDGAFSEGRPRYLQMI
ncbi:hypothetical protein [Halomonas sp. IOP_31]|uniref:hypothetical protein n=1 Tax=Halomonas sp. IOP_31 TaxID=2876584 RepID=UPI001E4321F0|nr:hypothetical protein [Halomonas sp. IOP_31]MCD6009393.1 hypothetical protein [Halomonas sp. IOP_31]